MVARKLDDELGQVSSDKPKTVGWATNDTVKVKQGLIRRDKTEAKKSVNDVLGKNKTKYSSYFKIRTPAVENTSYTDMEKEVLDCFRDLFLEMKHRDPKLTLLVWKEASNSKALGCLHWMVRRMFRRWEDAQSWKAQATPIPFCSTCHRFHPVPLSTPWTGVGSTNRGQPPQRSTCPA